MSELIKISKEFKGAMGCVWLGKEVEIPDGADDIAEFIKQNELLERAWMAMNPQINWSDDIVPKVFPTIKEPKDERIQSFIATINMCSSKKFLENFRVRVEEEKNEALTEAFNNKLKSFG